jgi:hypothetical protein
LLMYGTPTTGTGLVRAAELIGLALKWKVPGVGWIASWVIGRNRQLQELAAGSEFLQDLLDEWSFRVVNGGHISERDASRRTVLPVRMITGNRDHVVSESSAKGVYGEIDWHPISFGHIVLAKPASTTDPRYTLAKQFFKTCRLEKKSSELARIRAMSDTLWDARKGRMIRNWRYTASLDFSKPHPNEKLAAVGFSRCSFNCRYRMQLNQQHLVVGLSYDKTGGLGIWGEPPEPAYVHEIRVDLVPKGDRNRVTEGINRLLGIPDIHERWSQFFPSMSVRIDGHDALAGDIQPQTGPQVGWLRRLFEVPPELLHLMGDEVEFELIYESLAPTSLSSFSFFYPWLTDGCHCQLIVYDDLDYFVPFSHFGPGQRIEPEMNSLTKESAAVVVKTSDMVLPGSALDVHWRRRTVESA